MAAWQGNPAPIRAASPTLRRLFEVARERGIRVEDIAAELGAKPETVSRWRQGHQEPKVMTVEALAAIVGCDIIVGEGL